MKKLFLLFIVLLTIESANSQEKREKLKFNDLPGSFIFDLGLTHHRFAPGSMELRMLASRGANIYYTYDIKLIGENFSFSPGVGIGITNYFFKNRKTIIEAADTTRMVDLSVGDFGDLRRSKLNANYLDIPLEFRWRSNPDVNSFKIVLGAKAGVLLAAHTKIKYKKDGEMIKEKNSNDFQLNRFRYGVYARVGYGIFHFFGYYSLSELFNEGKAPEGRSVVPYMLGITISAF